MALREYHTLLYLTILERWFGMVIPLSVSHISRKSLSRLRRKNLQEHTERCDKEFVIILVS